MKQKEKTKKTALVQAVELLARQEHSIQRLREKLHQRGYEEEETEAAIQRLVEKHYLNDEDACARQFQYLYENSRSSVKQIQAKLMQRGFAGALIRECIPEDTYPRESRVALQCLRLKFRAGAEERRMMQHLYTRGFDSSVMRAAIHVFQQENNTEE